ncbi:MAG: thioredoxin family protein, partial [Bacteroidota bacterium]
MKKLFFQLAALVILLASFTSSEDAKFNIGDTAPLLDYEMVGLNNEPTTIVKSKLQNGVVVVFSCNTCPFVVGSNAFPGWERQYNELNTMAADYGLGFVLVNSNEAKREKDDSMEAMREHAKSKGYT